MSAGEEVANLDPPSAGDALASFRFARRTNDMQLLAPAFRRAVAASIAECNAAPNNLDAIVYETYRSNELQAVYYQRGRTVIPPPKPVTNAMSNLYSWHGYGLAVDVIHRTKQWGAGDAWFAKVAEIFKRHGCKWGGDWTTKDLPHFQWGLCKASPSSVARELIRTKGVEAVWQAVGANAEVGS
jgi:hypothetical protein